MNRAEYHELLEEIEAELREPGGNFDALFGHDETTLAQARLVAATALVAADRFYARLTRQAFDLREQDEQGLAGKK